MSTIGMWGIFVFVIFFYMVLFFRDRHKRRQIIKAHEIRSRKQRHCKNTFPRISTTESCNQINHQRRLLEEQLGQQSGMRTSSSKHFN